MVAHLILYMIEKVGIILIVAFLLSHMKSFRRIFQEDSTRNEKLVLICLFGGFGLVSNYTGIEVFQDTISNQGILLDIEPNNAIANTRVMGAVIGGLLGGPVVGLGAGLIAGLHRYTFGGFTAFACSLAVVLAGVLAGYCGRYKLKQGKRITASFAIKVGMLLEALQMGIILLLAKPFEQAWHLVQIIGLPMITINGLGILLFMMIMQSIMKDQSRARANQTSLVFSIAERTLPYFKQGLNGESSKAIASILLESTEADAVAITDTTRVLSHVGAGTDHHISMGELVTRLTKSVIERGQICVARTKDEIYCSSASCPLEAAIVLPLKVQHNTAGTLKMYYVDSHKLDDVQQQMAEGLANLFSTQLELAEVERQSKLLQDAEIRALHTQIHPHFLFNSLNSISVLCRTDPTKARDLMLELSLFFRSNLQGARQMFIPLEKEIENVAAYLSLEKARFPDKYEVEIKVDSSLLDFHIPPFLLQPLVENAIHHGLSRGKSKGFISIDITQQTDHLEIIVQDNGVGISSETLMVLGKQTVLSETGTGTSIDNISKRLEGLYKGQASISFKSLSGSGTKVFICIPLHFKKGDLSIAESIYS
ncbi:two-component system sensor histidine kinase LytS [Sporosarcina luteola]|nr:two-component system sensor histidine kinase LytS [Sporosarcina luteola]